MVRKIISKLAVLVLVSMLMPLAAFAVDDASRQVVLPGTIQSVLGGKDWDPAGEITRMKHVGKGVYEFTAKFPKGNYMFKVAIGGSWSENYGKDGSLNGGDIPLQIPQNNTEVKFIFDYKTKNITANVEIKGVNFGATLTNTIEQKTAYSNVTDTNKLRLDVISKTVKATGTIEYSPAYDIYAKKLAADTFKTKFYEWSVFTDLGLAQVTAQVNTAKDNKSSFKSSPDYLGLIDAGTVDDRNHGTKNPDKLDSDNYAIKVSTNKFVDLDAAYAEYVGDITKEAKDKKKFGYLYAQKEIIPDVFKAGVSSMYYQPIWKEKPGGEDPAMAITAFGEATPIKGLTVKGQYGLVPTGTIKSDLSSGSYKQADGKWKFVYTPKSGVTPKEVHLVGELSDSSNNEGQKGAFWNPADKTFALKDNGDGTWVGIFDITEGTKYKFTYDATSWNGNQDSDDRFVKETINYYTGLSLNGQMYYADINYDIMGKYFQLGKVRFMTSSISNDVFLPFAKDVLKDGLLGNNKHYTTVGAIVDGGTDVYLASGDYIIFDRFKAFASEEYRTLNSKGKYVVKNETKAGFDWNYNWDGRSKIFDNIKFDYTRDTAILNTRTPKTTKADQEKRDATYAEVDTTKNTENSFNATRNDYFLEIKTMELPIVGKMTLNTKQRINAGTQQYYAEIAPIEQIAYIKGDYVVVKGYQDTPISATVNAYKYNGEIKLQKLPLISSMISYVTAGFVHDETGLIDDQRYLFNDGDDNDWTERYYAETKVEIAALKDFSGLTLKGEMREIETGKHSTPANGEEGKDSQYYIGSKQGFINLYTIGTVETGYKLPFGIDTSLIAKYDFAHQNIAEYEDDALKATASVKVGPTTISASWNKKDKDNGKDYTKVEFKSVF